MILGAVLPKRRTADVPSVQLSLADEVAVFELNTLPDEAQRYLATVEAFRAAGCPPRWKNETDERGHDGQH